MSATSVRVTIDGAALDVDPGTTVAAALINAGDFTFRRSRTGEPRAPLCGMGVCHECRVTIDGAAHQRACMIVVCDGMRIETAAAER